jgi:hypothetical protein
MRGLYVQERRLLRRLSWKDLDVDRDGRISASKQASPRDLSAEEKMMFRKLDTDKDGHLSKAEFDAGHAALKK